MIISLYMWESGWEPHWQGASIYNSNIHMFSCYTFITGTKRCRKLLSFYLNSIYCLAGVFEFTKIYSRQRRTLFDFFPESSNLCTVTYDALICRRRRHQWSHPGLEELIWVQPHRCTPQPATRMMMKQALIFSNQLRYKHYRTRSYFLCHI